MDVVEFVERDLGLKLFDWQKEYLRELVKMRSNRNIRILTSRHGEMFVYMNPKELIQNGQTSHCK